MFAGRTAVVTGAGSGIGRAIARAMLESGATVFAADLDPSGAPDGCARIPTDVSDEASMRALFEAAGSVDLLFNNAGVGSTTDTLGCTVEEWDRLFAINARGVFLGTKLALPSMIEKGKGSIVNTASIAGLVGLKDRFAYCASKGAVIAMTRQVAVQYAGTGVRCNAIAPGTADTEWVGRLLDQADDPAAARASLIARQPVGRLGTAEEIAGAAVYLAGAEFVTGTILVIDGGLTAA